jgi:hypothetical protein
MGKTTIPDRQMRADFTRATAEGFSVWGYFAPGSKNVGFGPNTGLNLFAALGKHPQSGRYP